MSSANQPTVRMMEAARRVWLDSLCVMSAVEAALAADDRQMVVEGTPDYQQLLEDQILCAENAHALSPIHNDNYTAGALDALLHLRKVFVNGPSNLDRSLVARAKARKERTAEAVVGDVREQLEALVRAGHRGRVDIPGSGTFFLLG